MLLELKAKSSKFAYLRHDVMALQLKTLAGSFCGVDGGVAGIICSQRWHLFASYGGPH
ncbi:hypothetical protein [Pseudomonas matsuisoli]|uniref:Uncharacterized protein n=1 Tax=Pseudomonas matsuisoli TaxID=1515666 RepID=A0A917PUI1_9PSED|nr:hypothetical protein [Pseudomonas matsuisoli]GGJ92594.1 hypothetical protein GCM10009304_18020 [Pseudomonas matsuisoli]